MYLLNGQGIYIVIQEQGARHQFQEGEQPARSLSDHSSEIFTDISDAIPPPPPPPGPEVESRDQHFGRQGIAAGGLAGAIAALAERQAVGGDTAAPSQPTAQTTSPPYSGNYRATEVSNVEMESERHRPNPGEALSQSSDLRRMAEIGLSISGRGEEDAENSSRASEKLANWVSSTQKEYNGSSMNTWMGDQSSEQVEVGTSFSSSVPSASELPWEAPDGQNGESSSGSGFANNNDKVLVPDSFEEQMMLAMALSLADAQAKVRHGGNRSGPLPQSVNPIAEAQLRVRQGNSRSGPLPRPTYIGH